MTSDYPALDGEKCCAFDLHGRLVWMSPALGRTPKALLGFGYLEFVHHEDTFDLLSWIISPGDEALSCRCMMPGNGTNITARYAKFKFAGHWMVVGEYTPGWRGHKRLNALSLAVSLGAGVAASTKFGGCLVAMG